MRKAIDRSEVLMEAYPGAANDIDTYVDEHGGWVCEAHPHLPFPHDDCAGPGMILNEDPDEPLRDILHNNL